MVSESSDDTISKVSSRSVSSCDDDFSSDEGHSDTSETENLEPDIMQPIISEKETQILTMLSCFLRHNLSASASKDILETFKQMFPDSPSLQDTSYREMCAYIACDDVKEHHYCIKCNALFPSDKTVFICSTDKCQGVRYKGSDGSQQHKGTQPLGGFLVADIAKQLRYLMESPGILKVVFFKLHYDDSQQSYSNIKLSCVCRSSVWRHLLVSNAYYYIYTSQKQSDTFFLSFS